MAHIATTLYRQAPASLSLPLGLTRLLGATLFGVEHTLPPPSIVRDSDRALRRLLLAIIRGSTKRTLRADVEAPAYFDYFAFLCSFFGVLPTQWQAAVRRTKYLVRMCSQELHLLVASRQLIASLSSSSPAPSLTWTRDTVASASSLFSLIHLLRFLPHLGLIVDKDLVLDRSPNAKLATPTTIVAALNDPSSASSANLLATLSDQADVVTAAAHSHRSYTLSLGTPTARTAWRWGDTSIDDRILARGCILCDVPHRTSGTHITTVCQSNLARTLRRRVNRLVRNALPRGTDHTPLATLILHHPWSLTTALVTTALRDRTTATRYTPIGSRHWDKERNTGVILNTQTLPPHSLPPRRTLDTLLIAAFSTIRTFINAYRRATTDALDGDDHEPPAYNRAAEYRALQERDSDDDSDDDTDSESGVSSGDDSLDLPPQPDLNPPPNLTDSSSSSDDEPDVLFGDDSFDPPSPPPSPPPHHPPSGESFDANTHYRRRPLGTPHPAFLKRSKSVNPNIPLPEQLASTHLPDLVDQFYDSHESFPDTGDAEQTDADDDDSQPDPFSYDPPQRTDNDPPRSPYLSDLAELLLFDPYDQQTDSHMD